VSKYRFKELIDTHHTITIISHINPDADAIGSSLGLYAILKSYGKQVEVANFSKDIPRYLDFLPNFSKIKSRIEYEDSLIITCDSSTIDIVGFDIDGRDIINIDHHQTNEYYGICNIVDRSACATSEVIYNKFVDEFEIGLDSATCLYTALLSDTQHFTTNSVTQDTFTLAMQLMSLGVDHHEVSNNLTLRRSLASIRMLSKALDRLELYRDGTISVVKIDRDMIEQTGAIMSDMVGIADTSHSLATVEISIILIVQDMKTKVSMRSKVDDISAIAKDFNGGGHKYACGFSISTTNLEEVLDKILKKLR